MSFRADRKKPRLRYGVTDSKGTQCLDVEVELPSASMMHDMAITATRSIFLDLNVAYDFPMQRYRVPEGDQNSEPVFVPRQ